MQVRAVGGDSRPGADGHNDPLSTTYIITHVLHYLEQSGKEAPARSPASWTFHLHRLAT